MTPEQIIKRPIALTEKAADMKGQNKVAFEVARSANKNEIKTAVEALFNVKVADVNTQQYRGKPTASQFLTRVVLEGSSPYNSHWKDKVSGLSMPPNAVAITEGNARQLVSWILAL